MADNYLSGIAGFIKLGNNTYDFQKWGFSIKSGLPKVNNFVSGFQILVAGLKSGTITAEGPYNNTNMPITVGQYYQFTMGWDTNIYIVAGAYVESMDLDNDVEGAPRVRITAQTSQSFTLSIS